LRDIPGCAVLQARRVDHTSVDPRAIDLINGDDNRPTTGLIPSLQLEEKRKAFVRPEYDYSHRSRMLIFFHTFRCTLRGSLTLELMCAACSEQVVTC
jgi:hypothetical protein